MLPLNQIRTELNWSFSEMADALGLSKSTYQSYDEERRAVPHEILRAANEQLQRNREHVKRYAPGSDLDRILADVL